MINEKKNNNIKKILLAAGESKRFGDKNKLSAMINSKPIINYILDTLFEIYDPSELIVIVGHENKKIKSLSKNRGSLAFATDPHSLLNELRGNIQRK